MRRLTFLALIALALPEIAHAEPLDGGAPAQDRLLIVSGNSGRVVYDDGRDDLYCVTTRYTAAYEYDGRPIRRRSMKCR